ncbi:MAG: hypothetical protein QOE23_1097 [Pseudonocardiales bacterium]|nr:hypothetical protein [Pseudonocardiales bacterium]
MLGVRSADTGRLAYLAEPVPAGEVLGEIPEGIEPTRILRFASHCSTSCPHRRGADCSLVERVIVAAPPSTTVTVPRCHLRPKCQWWHQKGVAACHQCPAVSTAFEADDALTSLVADPATTLAQLEQWIAESA